MAESFYFMKPGECGLRLANCEGWGVKGAAGNPAGTQSQTNGETWLSLGC